MFNWILRRIGNIIGIILSIALIVWILGIIVLPFVALYWMLIK